jgi:FkbM family methyltransferase
MSFDNRNRRFTEFLFWRLLLPSYIFFSKIFKNIKIEESLFRLVAMSRGYLAPTNPEVNGEFALLKQIKSISSAWCIDIGANQGMYSKKILEDTDLRVIAIEPMPQSFEKLQNMKNQYPDRMYIFDVALGNHNHPSRIYFDSPTSELATTSAIALDVPYLSNVSSIEIKVLTLDTVLENNFGDLREVDLIKIDVEGSEIEVLEGATRTIMKYKPKFIQVEHNWHHLFTSQTLHSISRILPKYDVYQLDYIRKRFVKRDLRDPLSNLFLYSNWVFVRNDVDFQTMF